MLISFFWFFPILIDDQTEKVIKTEESVKWKFFRLVPNFVYVVNFTTEYFDGHKCTNLRT